MSMAYGIKATLPHYSVHTFVWLSADSILVLLQTAMHSTLHCMFKM